MGIQPYDVATERQKPASAFDAGLTRLVAAALGEKSLIWASLLGGIGIWVVALIHPDPWRLTAAAGYSLSIFIPVLLKRS